MREREMDYAFGSATLWKGKYKIDWCELCQSIILIHEECTGTTCNAHCCEKCCNDFAEFEALKMDPFWFLSEQERAAVEKDKILRKLLFDCLDAGKTTLDWQWLLWEGKLSRADEETFAEQLKGLKRNPEWEKYG